MGANLKDPFGPSCCDGGACSEAFSAEPCGCDKGEDHLCERHTVEAEFRAEIEKEDKEWLKHQED